MGESERVWVMVRRRKRPAYHDDPACRSFKGQQPRDISEESAVRGGYSPCRFCCRERAGSVLA